MKNAKINKKNRSLLVNLTTNGYFKNYFKLCEPALKSLLKAFLPLPDNSSIQKVKIMDSFLPSIKEEDKNSIMDLRLQLNTGELVNVEMQAFPHKSFTERVLFYWAKNYVSQLKEGEKYTRLCPSYSLIFNTFNLFPNTKRLYNSFSVRSDKEPYFCFNHDLCFVTVELSKFQSREVSSLIDLRDIWCYLLKSSGNMRESDFKELLSKQPDMEEAMVYLRKFSEEEQQQILTEAKEKNHRDQMAREDYVFDQGLQEGMEKGRQEGMEKGRQEGVEKLIINMLKNGASVNFISKYTDWSEEKIKQIKDRYTTES